MQVGIIGLGKMGGNMAKRWIRAGHSVVGFNLTKEPLLELGRDGGTPTGSVEELLGKLAAPRVVWLMIPAGKPVDDTIEEILPHIETGDIVVDGGNSNYHDTMRRGKGLAEKGIAYIDVGTSGGVWGLTEGYSMMVGGEKDAVDRVRPLLETLAPGPQQGWGHVGPSGAGHFVKMVHNGIEYGMMEAYAEGFEILHKKEEFGIDLNQVAEIWRFGSVIRSWLLDLAARAFAEDPTLEHIEPWVADSGEGRWTVQAAIDLNVPAPVIAHSLFERLRSRDEESFSDRLLSALRNQFGGHAMKMES